MTEGKQIYYHRLRENSRKMHPRLKELAVEAGAYKDNGTILHGPMDVTKYAELIVKECADIADEYDGVGSTIVSRIKKHFGLKE